MTDLLVGGPDTPPWRPRPWMVVAAVVAVAGVAAIAIASGSGGGTAAGHSGHGGPDGQSGQLTCVSGPTQPPSAPVAGLALAPPDSHHSKGYAFLSGAGNRQPPRWSAIIRNSTSPLAANQAVVTFPASQATTGDTVNVNGGQGRINGTTLNWAIAGAHAQATGQISPDLLIALARHIDIRGGRPVLNSQALGLTVAATVPFAPLATHEIRYPANRLGSAGRRLGGLVFTGVTRAASIDDWELKTQTPIIDRVRGVPVVRTHRFGGNGALVWEPQPGTVAYVGYSGTEFTDQTVAALDCLAQESVPLTQAQWRQSLAGPSPKNSR